MENPRSRSRSPPSWRYNVNFVRPSDEHLNQFLPAAEPGPQVRWLVDQREGWYQEAQYFGAHLEEMYQKNVEIADGELVFKDGWVHWYRHKMIKGNPVMTQTRYRDQGRTEIMCEKEIVRVFMQTSLEQRWGPKPPPRTSDNMQD